MMEGTTEGEHLTLLEDPKQRITWDLPLKVATDLMNLYTIIGK